uniref:Uncharacterized protein n=1 Tax=Anguilla anguilla TaxID=7936 RepID=A0A0E9PPX5_ANGAN
MNDSSVFNCFQMLKC